MRSAVLSNGNGDLRIDLGSDVGIINEIIEVGKGVDYLIYKAEMNSEELISFLKKFNLYEKYGSVIKQEEKYILTAYDW